MMKKIQTLLAIVGFMVLFCAVFYYWGMMSANKKNVAGIKVDSQIILDKITDQSFLVTKTLFLDSEAKINIRDGSGFKGFFVGQEISARSMVRVDIGEDFSKLAANDIILDRDGRKAVIYLSGAEILDSSIFGDVEIESKKGLWTNIKQLFNDDKSFEYNLSANELIASANFAVADNEDFFREANRSAGEFVSFAVKSLLPEYETVIKTK